MPHPQSADNTLAYTVPLTLANKQYSQALPDGTKALEFKTRTGSLKYAFESGKVAGADGLSAAVEPYQTLESGQPYSQSGLFLNKPVLYLATPDAGSVVEIRAWF